MTETPDIKAVRMENRVLLGMMAFIASVVTSLAGWWLQNQHDDVQDLERQFGIYKQFVDGNYIDNVTANIIREEYNRRFMSIERLHKELADAMERRHPPGRTPLGTSRRLESPYLPGGSK